MSDPNADTRGDMPDNLIRSDVREAAQRRARKGIPPGLILLVLLALAAFAWWWAFYRKPAREPTLPAVSTAPAPSASEPVAMAPAPAPAPPAIQNPIDAPAAGSKEAVSLPALNAADPMVRKALIDWLGDKAVGSVVRSDDFVRRVVVTVDNLGREHAAPRLWPVNPAPGKFIVQRQGDREVAAPDNAVRYQAIVALATSVDPGRAARLYRQHYPLFQEAYREAGYPNGYFNDRLIEVIDRLLATPEPTQPPAVRKVEIKGELAGTQTSSFYEFTDPALDKLSAGQKALLRMGNDNARKVKGQLRTFRAAIAKTPPPKG